VHIPVTGSDLYFKKTTVAYSEELLAEPVEETGFFVNMSDKKVKSAIPA